jgi:hypothetical protein
MKTKLLLTMAVVVTFLVIPEPSNAWVGAVCQRTNASSPAYHTQYGATNDSASSAGVWCPLTVWQTLPTNTHVYVRVYDRKPTYDISCHLMILYSDGTIFSNQIRNSSGGGVGSGIQDIDFNNGNGFNMTMSCSLPGSVNVNWPSHITGIGTHPH